MKRDTPSLPGAARRRFLGASLALLLAACGSEPHTFNFQIAATGTRLEAEQVVALVYAQAPDAAIEKLLYSGGDLTRAIKRLRDRHAQLKPWLEQGVIGQSTSGFVALRDPARQAQLAELLSAENHDRAFLYTEVAVVVGHGGDTLAAWRPYASESFGKEWRAQGAPTWWWVDEQNAWHQGAAPATATP